MLKKARWSVVFAALGLGMLLNTAWAASPGKAQVEHRLDYLTSLRDFSKARPLSQARLLNLIQDLGRFGKFPEKYRQGKKPTSAKNQMVEGCDDFISRANARRFLREWVGQDLKIWGTDSDAGSNPKFVGDKMGWWFNTGNSMSVPPKVLVTSRKDTGRKLITVQFRIFHRQGRIYNNPPATLVATGAAKLERVRNSWTVTSWKVNRNKNWAYGED